MFYCPFIFEFSLYIVDKEKQNNEESSLSLNIQRLNCTIHEEHHYSRSKLTYLSFTKP